MPNEQYTGQFIWFVDVSDGEETGRATIINAEITKSDCTMEFVLRDPKEGASFYNSLLHWDDKEAMHIGEWWVKDDPEDCGDIFGIFVKRHEGYTFKGKWREEDYGDENNLEPNLYRVEANLILE